MTTQKALQNKLEDSRVNVKLKLASLWASFMFLYIYVDYFGLYMPNKVTDIQQGIVFKFDISPGFLLTALISISIPALMIFLSATLPAKINRWVNITLAGLYIPYSLFNLTGEAWAHMYVAAAIEVVLLCIILYYAWKWPREINN